MSGSDLQAIVASLQFGDYISLVVPTAVAYDYILALPKEINYIWLKPWSFVTLIYFLVRYLGLTAAMIDGLYASTFIPGPILDPTDNIWIQGNVLLLLDVCAFNIYLAASDIVMILRVYAMWNKSRIILGVLLVFYVAEIILFIASAAYYNNPDTNMTMTIAQVLNMSFCNPIYNTTDKLGEYKFAPRITLSALLLIFSVSRLCLEGYRTYQVTKRLEINRYVQLLVREGVLYFLAHLLFIIDFGETTSGIIMTVISTIGMYIVSPRFIISVRELYFSSLVRVTGLDTGVDTGFGIGKSGVSEVGFTHSGTTYETTEEDVELHGL